MFADNPFGVRTKFSVGSNGIGRSGMIAVGAKGAAFTDTGSLGVMAAISGSSIYSNFNNGDGVSSEDFGYDEFMKQNPKSQLFKVDIKPNEYHSIELSAELTRINSRAAISTATIFISNITMRHFLSGWI